MKYRLISERTIFIAGIGCLFWAGLTGARASSPTARARPASEARASTVGSRVTETIETHSTEDKQHGTTPAIVIGFVGGFVGRNNAVHSPVQLGQRLKKEYPAGVYVEVFENRRREEAHRRILSILRGGKDDPLTGDEKKNAKIIIYGMSWGGSEAVGLARELNAEKIPVLLTIQVDSVAKFGQNDEVIPVNVAEAANFYQHDGLLHGRSEIRAADAKQTRILGNFRYEYKTKSVNCEKYPWWDRVFTKYHTEIECDPEVWGRVETMIRAKLPAVEDRPAAQASQP